MLIQSGDQAGQAFELDRPEVQIGRVQENDLVLRHPSVSRRHAKLVEKLGKYFVEDLGSSTGTRVNDQAVREPTPLSAGDRLGVGDIELRIEGQARLQSQETRIVDRPDGGSDRAITEEAMIVTQPPRLAETDTARVALPPPSRREGVAISPASSSGGLSAAERARRRRQYGDTLGGQLRYVWSELSPRARALTTLAVAAVVLGAGAALWAVFKPQSPNLPAGPEPHELSARPVRDSFGLGGPGDDVTWNRPDMKVFTFTFLAPTRAVAVLHYQARDISEGEVRVSLNGAEVGAVPADTQDVLEREIELVLPAELLKRGAGNQVLFDNVRNPPGREPWRIWDLWVEIIPVPELTEKELVAQASEFAKKAKEFYDLKDVGADNLFKAWKAYRNAWITLEAMPKKPELYSLVRAQMNAIGRDLNQQCGKMMLDAERSLQLKNRKRAKQTLEDVARYFPTGEHRCHNLALEKLNEL